MNNVISKHEKLVLCGLLAIYSIAHLFLINYQIVFSDEPGYTDPAASYHLGQGFTSGAWYAQKDDEFFAGNVPLHSFCLIVWYKFFDFGIIQTRSINILFVALGTWLLWITIKRSGFISKPSLRISVISILLFGETAYHLSLLGRPDGITYLLAALGLFSLSLLRNSIRLATLGAVGFLSTLAGLQLVAAWAIASIIVLLFVPWKKYISEIFALGAGCVLGAFALFWLYKVNGVWDAFVNSIFPHTQTLSKSIYRFSGFWGDKSYLLVCISILILSIWTLSTSKIDAFSKIKLGLALSVGLPLGLLITGKFSYHYCWIGLLPGIFYIFHVIDSSRPSRKIIVLLSFLLLLSVAFGTPRRLMNAFINLKYGLHEKTSHLVKKFVLPEDIVLYSGNEYYAVKQKAKKTYYINWYLDLLSDNEKASITLLIIRRDQIKTVYDNLGPSWNEITSYIVPNWIYPWKTLNDEYTLLRRSAD